ncbi:MAG: thiolase family protein [Acidimicrobiia bacterium]|nr:thiolase family protein [Acidimicrobiia bacterium]
MFRNRVAIAGAGVVRSERHAEVPVGSLAVQMSDAAIADAGLTRADIDGVSCGTSLPADTARTLRPGHDFVDSNFLIEHMGLRPVWSLDDGSFPPSLVKAVIAVASGAATCVLVNRTVHNPVGRYHSFPSLEAGGWSQWTAPYGYVGWISGMAMAYLEYQQRFGARREHMATLVLQMRENVQRISEAYWCGRPLTFDEYMCARMISEPLCLFDNDIPVDGGGSFIVTTADRARDLPHRPVYVTSYAMVRKYKPWPAIPGTLGALQEYYDGGYDLAERLWGESGWRAEDCDIVQLYDGFAMEVWYWLEVLGFCGEGEAWEFIQDGRIAPDGPFPLNSGGGNQGWGRLHGVPQVLECYLQLAGRAGARQTPDAVRGISTYGDPAHQVGTALLYTNDLAA